MKKFLFVISMTLALVTPAFVVAGTASAGTSKAAYEWHVADDFLETAVGSPPWAIATAANGDKILLDGSGSLDAGAKTADGSGRVIHKAADGTVLGRGTLPCTG